MNGCGWSGVAVVRGGSVKKMLLNANVFYCCCCCCVVEFFPFVEQDFGYEPHVERTTR